MTRKEAIKILKDSMAGRMVMYKDSIQATQMAIAALEKSPHWMPLPQAPTVAKNATVKEKGGKE